jgi:hypothetical protein
VITVVPVKLYPYWPVWDLADGCKYGDGADPKVDVFLLGQRFVGNETGILVEKTVAVVHHN